jgi:hypothetical protein
VSEHLSQQEYFCLRFSTPALQEPWLKKRMTDFRKARPTRAQNDSQCEVMNMLRLSSEYGKTGNSRNITNIKHTSNNRQYGI